MMHTAWLFLIFYVTYNSGITFFHFVILGRSIYICAGYFYWFHRLITLDLLWFIYLPYFLRVTRSRSIDVCRVSMCFTGIKLLPEAFSYVGHLALDVSSFVMTLHNRLYRLTHFCVRTTYYLTPYEILGIETCWGMERYNLLPLLMSLNMLSFW